MAVETGEPVVALPVAQVLLENEVLRSHLTTAPASQMGLVTV